MSNSKYISLHNHSYYSYLDSLARPDEMAKKAKELGYSALALGDHGNVTGHIEFQKSCKKYGIKPILGIEAYWTNDHQAKERKSNHLTVLCQNNEGLSNLYKLTYISSKPVEQEGGFYYKPRISWADLEKYHKGLIVLSGCMASIINRAFSNNDYQLGKEYAERFIKILGKDRFFVEIQLVNDPLDKPDREIFIKEQDIIIESSRKLAKDLGLRCCATSDSHYVNKDDSFPHECLKAIEARATLNDPPANRDTGERGRLVFNGYDYYLRSEDEMKAKFTEEEINNTKLVAEMCNAEIPLKQNHMPKFDKDLSPSQSIELLKEKLREGWAKLGIAKKINKQEYLDRVKKEIADIEEAFLQDYFLIVWDVVKFCLNNKIPVGIGRGCLTGDCLVHTERGLINLSDVIIGDTVYDHLGLPQKVLKTYKYPVDEELLNIKTTNSFGSITLTKDHKVYAFRRKIGCDGVYQNINTKPEWIEAGLLKKGDALIIPNINNRRIINQNNVDLSSYADNDFIIENDKISKNIPIKNYIGIRALSKTLGISRNFLQKAKRGKLSDYTSDGRIATRTIKSLNSLCEHLNKNSIDYETWKKNKNTNINTFDRYLKWDEEFAYQIGKWVGDGWVATKTKYQVGIAFNSDDTFEIERTQKFFIDKGFKVSIRKEKDTKLTQLLINNKLLALWIKSFFCDYENTSKTKYLGDLVYLPNNLLRSLILGLQSADGHVEKYRECIDTTSPRLAKDIRTSLLYMGIKSSRITRKPFKRDKYLCKESYKIRFKGLSVPSKTKDEHKNIVRILDIKTSRSNFVYDITVNNSHSYLTSNFVVHNSASGSLCAYLLEITAVDPIEYGLIWERFYNIGRKGSYPDIDLDISIERRNEVVDYLRNKFGEDRIFQMCTVSTMASKAAIKDVGKVIGLPFSYMNELTDLFPHKCESIKQAIEEVPEIKALATEGEDKDTERWKQEISGSKDKAQIKVLEDMIAERQRQLKVTFDVAQRLENIARQRSSHASAILIADEPVFGKIPLCYDAKNGKTLTAFDMYDLEEMGYLKLDILGLKTLDVCSKIYNGNIRDFKDFSDKRVYELISNGYTRGIFQLETPLGKNWCKKIKPKNLNELSDINALLRPAVLEIEMADEYLKNRAKPEEIIYLHEELKPILKDTYGICVYQEELIEIIKKFAGFNLVESDAVRKCFARKLPQEMIKHEKNFIEGCIKNKYKEELAKELWKWIDASSGYNFNKCISGETLVYRGNKERSKSIISIEHLFKIKNDKQYAIHGYGQILALDKDGRIRPRKIKDIYFNGKKETYTITLSNGKSIRTTKDHKFYTNNGYVKVEDFLINETSIICNNLNETEESIVISIEYHGLEDTYDIEMDTEEHNFVANGMVCSNSHSLAYAKLAYITAYLKLNDPSKFFWSLLYYSKNEQNPQEEIRSIFFDAKRFNVHILPPSIKRANKDFEVDGNNIYFGLSHVKGIGESAIKYIEKISGMSWHDILFSKIKKNIFDGMVLSGAMSHFGLSRKQMMMCKEFINQLTEKELPIFNHIFTGIPDKITKETKSEIKSLQLQKGKSFEESVQTMLDFINKENKELKIINANRASNLAIECQYFISNYDNGKEYCIRDLARFEGHYLGIPATCSSVDSFLNEKVSHFLIEVEKEKDNTQICVVAKISSFRQILDKRQREMAFITLEDKSFMLDAVMFNSCYSIHKTLIKQDSVLLFKGHKKGGSFIVNHVEQS